MVVLCGQRSTTKQKANKAQNRKTVMSEIKGVLLTSQQRVAVANFIKFKAEMKSANQKKSNLIFL